MITFPVLTRIRRGGGVVGCPVAFTRRDTGATPVRLSGIAYANGYWVIGSETGKLITNTGNPTGAWTRNITTRDRCSQVAFGNGIWTIGGHDAWLQNTATGDPSGPFTDRWGGIAQVQDILYANGHWLAVAYSGGMTHATAAAPNTWTVITPPVLAPYDLKGLAFGNGRWVCVGTNNLIATTATGDPTLAWTLQASPLAGTPSIYKVAYGNGYFVATTSTGSLLYAAEADLTTWTERTTILTGANWPNSIKYINGCWISGTSSAVLGNTFFLLANDPTGIWVRILSNGMSHDIAGIDYGNGYWVASDLSIPNSSIVYAT